MPTEVRVRRDPSELSNRFITGILVVLVAVMGMFGVLFFHITSQTSKDIQQLEYRVLVLESKTGIKQPLNNSVK
jgi:anionic cell wall polymer biosynthesis LytR-Cps2A-Psr (LCP) family protein